MIENIGFYALLPTLSAFFCLYLLRRLFQRQAEREYLILFMNLAVINIAQTTGYLLFTHSQQLAEYAADGYLISAYFFFAHLVLLALNLSTSPPSRQQQRILYIAPILLTIFHLTGFMIESYRIEHNSLMHNDGQLAWLLDMFILVSCLAAISLFWKNLKQAKDNRTLFSKNAIALLSFIPLTAAFFIIVLLSTTTYAIPVVLIGPTVTLYTAITFYYLSRDQVADLSIGLLFFFRRVKLAYQLLETNKTKAEIKQFNRNVEKQFIKETLVAHKGNIQAAADAMEINHTTLRNKIKEYEIDIENNHEKALSEPTR